ncbi:50S ribosomal protein L11 methyltransferase [Defluviitalea raffinosedens]|uniref:50S ribosomal protein L11 methyltransferase n=1 Tax=Defluviitalea raffinosedens TaxID=1450156 RepID=UPI001D8FA200|nr:ribosomal protein L11 methyltransferase [Defluviitalea raffinosedens]
MKWIRLTISTKSEAVEAISYALTNIGIPTIEIDDPNDITMTMEKKNKTDWDYIDEELLKSKDMNEVLIKVYLPEDAPYEEKIIQIQNSLNHIKQFLDVGKGTVQTDVLHEEEWANSWKKYYKPIKIGKNIVIKPSWEEYTSTDEREIIIEMDPGMAFGTGTHETTAMCLELLEKYITKGNIVFDIGCGSGILGIASAKLGASSVIGVDLDANAVKVAKNNVNSNHVEHIMKVYEGNLLDVVNEKADIVVANIIADVIIELSESVLDFLNPKGFFIASGIIKERLQDVQEAMTKNRLDIVEIFEEGSWCALAAKMKE